MSYPPAPPTAPVATVVSAGGAPPPPYQQPPAAVVGIVGDSETHLDLGGRVNKMQMELDLPEEIVRDLLSVAGADIVVVADDSGSMSCVANYGPPPKTRWHELQETLVKLAHMLLVVDHSDGFHLQFLNDPTWHNIKSKANVETLFYGRSPRGRTPLGERLRPLLSGQWHPKGHGAETDLILLVMTDGEPSDVTFDGLRQMVAGKKGTVYVTFMMCTEEDDVVEQYNKHLDKIPNVDITDDYASEKREVEAFGRKLSYFKWMAKAVLGGKMPKYDRMDEKSVRPGGAGGGGCCTIS